MSIHRRAIALIVLLSVLTTGCGTLQPTAAVVPTPSVTPMPPAPTLVVSPTPTVVDISPEARVYLDQALAIMQEHSMVRDRVDWETVRAKAYRKAWGARTPADTYSAIGLALGELGDHHSYLLSPDRVADLEDGTMAAASPDPWGELLEERLGYLFLPGWAGLGDLANGHATRIQQIVRELDAFAPCGWILDLRENTGGSMWPMLAGVGPVLGEGRVGAFVSADGQQDDWIYANGQARMGDDVLTEVEGPTYVLAEPLPPVAVLIGPSTISAGEAIAIAFRGRPNTRSFGHLTAGLSTGPWEFVLSDGAWMMLVVSAFADRTGQVYGSWIVPDQVVTQRGTEGDPPLQAAIGWLLDQPACRADGVQQASPPAVAALGDTWDRPADGMVMVYVPGGTFLMGSTAAQIDAAKALCEQYPDEYGKCKTESFEAEAPQHAVTVDGTWLDRTEVTNAQYALCVADGACRESRLADHPAYNGDDYPVAGIPWQDAADYCSWVGGRLPTEAEWEYAARGPEGHVFPWGDQFECTAGNLWDDVTGCDDGYPRPAPVGSFPAGISWCGALDMAGNAWEWVADLYGAYPAENQINPTGPAAGSERILRGGSWGYVPAYVRTMYRYPVPATADYFAVGFRCTVPTGE
jgi:carboxyl-terminal processing protease